MDLKKLAGTLLSSDAISGLSSATGASGSDITSVLKAALPSLLSGATNQAKDSSTAEGFAAALSNHAKDDTNDLTKFLGNIDLQDGTKIISHLLGSDRDNVVNNVVKETGVSKAKTNSILSAIAPLLMSLLGQQTDEDKDSGLDLGGLVGTLIDNVDVGDLLGNLLGSGSDSSASTGTGKKKKASSGSNMLSGLLKGLLKK